jgi:predicted lysophospholipase L1 biosynthesis ABC-type transport system permease subunit
MTGAGLVLRSFAKLVSVDLGLSTDNVLTLEVEPLEQNAAVRREYYVSLAEALRQLPEVGSLGAIDQNAFTGATYYGVKTDTGASFDGPQRHVLPGYFQAVGVRPLAGRLLEDADRTSAEPVVVNEIAAQRYFDGNAVGHTLQLGDKHPRHLRIVGVVPTLRHGGPRGRIRPELYMLPDLRETAISSVRLTMVMRLKEGTSLPVERLKQVAEAIGTRVLFGRVRPAAELLSAHNTLARHRMLLLTMLGVFGLLLTLVGIFSMTAYAVARRTREIGVRVAFGARPAQVVGVMIRDAVWPVVFGLGAGLAGTYYATRIITSFLFETKPHDPATLAAVAVLLGIAACVAAWLPARRAAAVDPVAALRAE